MRIRHARLNDIPEIIEVEQQAARADGREARAEAELTSLLTELCAEGNIFVVTDDDDELNTWGQAGTLDGLGGPVAGYTMLTSARGWNAYYFTCWGAVAPQYRGQRAGRLLLQGALNRARMLESEVEQKRIYFEALLPAHDPASPALAAHFEMLPVPAETAGMQLYRKEL